MSAEKDADYDYLFKSALIVLFIFRKAMEAHAAYTLALWLTVLIACCWLVPRLAWLQSS
jgi:hypothetical protein